MYIEYPKWLYHADGRSVVVNDREEEAALGEGWADTPAAFPAREPKSKWTRVKGKKP